MKFPKVKFDKKAFRRIGEAAKVVVIVAEQVARQLEHITKKK